MVVQVARAIGGAGTGKTRMMMETAEKALERPETAGNPFSIGFSSFTRAARGEASGRASAAWGIPQSELERDGWFRTCHSVAHKVLEIQKGEVIGNSKVDDAWVSEALGSDVHTSLTDDEEGGIAIYAGDKVAAASLNYWSLARSMVVPLRQVVEADQSPEAPAADEVVKRITAYEQAKRLEGRSDFTDLLCRFVGLRHSPEDGPQSVAPEGKVPETVVGWIFDEAQDASKLLDLACRRLVTGEACRWAWLVGDPYQVLYGWAGASASYFMGWAAAKQKVMPKSYRCAAPILALAERCLQRLGSDYWDRGIAPADHDGRVLESENFEEDLADIDPREETLCVARTNRQVKKMAAILHEVGVPFRYVKAKQGALNKDIGMAGLWKLQHGGGCSKDEWSCAMDLLPSKTSDGQTWLVRGSKAQWDRGLSDRFDRLYPEDLPEVGVTPALREAIATGKWAGLCDGGSQWYSAAKRYGVEVVSEPKVRIGTIHCSPPDEPVLTTEGCVPIGSLDSSRHRLCSASINGGLMATWGGIGPRGDTPEGFRFVSASRDYSGDLITIETERSRTRVTPCHRLVVRWAPSFYDKWLVYLMRLGDWWRVGLSRTATIPYRPGGIGGRLSTEKADSCWILGIYESDREARVAEAMIQSKYGIPGLCFRKTAKLATPKLTTGDLQSVHAACVNDVAPRVARLMDDFGLLIDYPIRKRDRSAVFGKVFETAAANFMAGYMEMPVVGEGFSFKSSRAKPDWLHAKAARQHYEGKVHSLEVLPHHFYVSGNAIVHNSVKGQEADNVILLTSQGGRTAQAEMDDPERFAEERRVEYVAVTRARRKLIVAHDPREKYRMELPL